MATRAPLILLPPSEGKAPGGRGAPWAPGRSAHPTLDPHRERVIDALAAALATDTDTGALFGVGGDALARAVAAGTSIRTSPTMPAIARYTGVLYDALDHRTLTGPLRRRLGAQVRIFSGLWGLVAPADPLPDYRLKMGATLPGTGRLATFWRPHLDPVLDELADRRVVWNLLPGEHAAAWSGSSAAAGEITVRFLDDVGTGADRRLITVSHWNKLLKGALVRHVLATGADDPDALAGFEHPEGYRYEPSLTETGRRATSVAMVARR